MAKKGNEPKKATARKTATRKKTASKKTMATNDGRPLLLDEYTDVGDLIERGTDDDRITAAIFCNYPVGNLNVVHLKNDDLKNIAATFTADDWITYGYHAAIHETAYEFLKDFQRAARHFLTCGRILHSYVLTHKSARETAEMLTQIYQKAPRDHTDINKTLSLAPSLYGWNISPDGVVTPDFKQDIGGGMTFEKIIKGASVEVWAAMRAAKALYEAFTRFRDQLDDEITLKRKDAIFFSEFIKENLNTLMKEYAPFPEYSVGYVKEYAELKGVDMNQLPAEMLEIDYFPTWGMATPDPLQISERETYLFRELLDNARDYARIVADATGLSKFDMGGEYGFTYVRAPKTETYDVTGKLFKRNGAK